MCNYARNKPKYFEKKIDRRWFYFLYLFKLPIWICFCFYFVSPFLFFYSFCRLWNVDTPIIPSLSIFMKMLTNLNLFWLFIHSLICARISNEEEKKNEKKNKIIGFRESNTYINICVVLFFLLHLYNTYTV